MGVCNKKLLLGQITLHFFLALTIIKSGFADVVNQQSSGSSTLLSQVLELLEYEPPPRGRPEDTEDGGSRGSCDLLAILPTHGYGMTAAEYPTFWFYLKNQPSLSKSMQLQLQDEQQNVVYKTTFELTQSEGIIQFRLPQTAPPLAIGKKYRWILSYGGMNDEIYTSGVIERIALEPEFESQLKQATPRERLYLFAKKRLWYDTLTELNQLRRTNPQDTELNSAWTNLLNSLSRKINCPL
ncbi:DUF928 domain-containing protein [Planktothrix sp. FACHB-1355]|uniref:DUF928 domain-containing protein n=1 Tax=Aerosakkonema funiforme FACHB-1375 TaxID=2949571 RepID=A0A926ZHM2_9CYAN|nr:MULTISPECIES: DUF928 domain-containing protein [Oscillatoriales]MBD2183200.1 DUF928 domain-containing protein [Aerosakkonema funiforme FACHB-1375]MBD3557440.1 DUF928 domain-containing protein [Planktothrix sp. FACHB-1355]